MNDNIMRMAGFGKQVDLKNRGLCVFCKSDKTNREDFKDELSWKEYNISGMCQTCQDGFFE